MIVFIYYDLKDYLYFLCNCYHHLILRNSRKKSRDIDHVIYGAIVIACTAQPQTN